MTSSLASKYEKANPRKALIRDLLYRRHDVTIEDYAVDGQTYLSRR